MTGYDAHTEQEIIVESCQPGMMHARHRKKKVPGIKCVFYISLQCLIVELFAQTNV